MHYKTKILKEVYIVRLKSTRLLLLITINLVFLVACNESQKVFKYEGVVIESVGVKFNGGDPCYEVYFEKNDELNYYDTVCSKESFKSGDTVTVYHNGKFAVGLLKDDDK